MQQKIDTRKTVDTKKVLTPEQALAIYERMTRTSEEDVSQALTSIPYRPLQVREFMR